MLLPVFIPYSTIMYISTAAAHHQTSTQHLLKSFCVLTSQQFHRQYSTHAHDPSTSVAANRLLSRQPHQLFLSIIFHGYYHHISNWSFYFSFQVVSKLNDIIAKLLSFYNYYALFSLYNGNFSLDIPAVLVTTSVI